MKEVRNLVRSLENADHSNRQGAACLYFGCLRYTLLRYSNTLTSSKLHIYSQKTISLATYSRLASSKSGSMSPPTVALHDRAWSRLLPALQVLPNQPTAREILLVLPRRLPANPKLLSSIACIAIINNGLDFLFVFEYLLQIVGVLGTRCVWTTCNNEAFDVQCWSVGAQHSLPPLTCACLSV